MFKLDLEKAEKTEIKCQHPLDHKQSKRDPEKHLLLLYWRCQGLWLCGSQQTMKFFKRWEYQITWPPSWEICMQVKKQQLKLDMEQQTGSKYEKRYVKAVFWHPAYLTYNAEYIMQNAGLDETQAGIKIAGRNINNFRYADDTTLRTESEEELKTSWWKWKSWLKTEQSKSEDHGIRSHHFIANTWGKQWNQWETLFSWAPKSLQMKLKDACFLEEKQWPT